MMNTRLLAGLLAMAALSGCASAPSGCDSSNRDASLLAKMNCDYSGGYRSQVLQKEQELRAARAENELFHQVYQDIQAQQAASRQGLREQERQQAALDQSLGRLLAQLKKRHAAKSQVQQQIGQLEQELQGARSPSPAGSGPQQLNAKQQELQALQQKVNRLQFSLGYE